MKESTYRIIELRKEGKTYAQISLETGLSKGNISYICNRYIPDNSAIYSKSKSAALVKNSRNFYEKRALYYLKNKAEKTSYWLGKLQKMPLSAVAYMAGFYDGEGNHKGTRFSVCNSNKEIILFVIKFLEDVGLPMRLTLQLHSTHDKNACLTYWSLPFDYVRQYDNRQQKRNYSATENYGTVIVSGIKPLGFRDALLTFSLASRSYQG